jgi:hypothetical protein
MKEALFSPEFTQLTGAFQRYLLRRKWLTLLTAVTVLPSLYVWHLLIEMLFEWL